MKVNLFCMIDSVKCYRLSEILVMLTMVLWVHIRSTHPSQ